MAPIDLPWRSGADEADEPGVDADPDADESRAGADADESEADASADGSETGADPVVTCEFQDGTLAVTETAVTIERADRSKFDDKSIPLAEVTDVEYDGGITVGYLQVVQAGVEADTGGLLSDPVDENTLHFDRSGRECATEARDAILERVRG